MPITISISSFVRTLVVILVMHSPRQLVLAAPSCPPKTGDVFSIGLMNAATPYGVSALLAVEDVNLDAFVDMSTLGCFPFNLTLFRGGVPEDDVCAGQPEYSFPYAITDSMEECDPSTICYPRNMLWKQASCSIANAENAGAAAAELLEMEPELVAVIGPGCSAPAYSAHDTLAAADVPLISGSATSSRLSNETAYPYFFRTIRPDGAQARAMVDLAKKLNATSASIVSDTSQFAQEFAGEIIGYLESSGIELREHRELPSTIVPVPDVTADVAALVAAEADVTFAVNWACPTAQTVLEASTIQNYESSWILSDVLGYAKCVPADFDGRVLSTKVRPR